MSPLWTRGAILKADEAIDWQELPALEGTLTLSAPGYAELSLPIALGPGEIRDLGALSLSPQALTRGRGPRSLWLPPRRGASFRPG